MPAELSRLRQQLVSIVQASPWFMLALNTVRSLHLDSCCIGAGAVRNLVWDHLHGYDTPSFLPDVDVAYFDSRDLQKETEQTLQAALAAHCSSIPWEITNQASVHLWFERYFGYPVAPLNSLEEGVASWPELATAVGVFLTGDARIEVIAPHGLNDLFSMVVRRNPVRVSVETYRRRLAEKQYAQRWPRVTIVSE